MPRGRKASSDPPIEWSVNIPTSLAVEVTLYLPRDPAKGTVKHGARATLIQHLLRKWLEEQQKGVQYAE